MAPDPVRVAEDIRDVLIKHGLRSIEAMTDTHTIIIRETGIMDDEYPQLKTETEENVL